MGKLNYTVQPGGSLCGRLRAPGDKSISHRAVMLGSLADGLTRIQGFLEGADCLATVDAFRGLGVTIEGPEQGHLIVHGVGMKGLREPATALDMGNSGTGMRLLTGLLAGQNFSSTLIGDESLSRRPMRRIIEPLTRMGASISATEQGTAPLAIHGGQPLTGIEYAMPVASAQVKSCLLLAGLYARGTTRISEPAPTRDHTERLLTGFGYALERRDNHIVLNGGGHLHSCDIDIPADISSAAFFLVGASIAPDSDLLLEHVGINPTRTGIITLLKQMGANIIMSNERLSGGEPVADLRVRSAPLHGIRIPESLVPLAIDEFPAIFIAAAYAEGETVLSGAEELRLKESDRIQVMADGLQALGGVAQATPDGIVIQGGSLQGGAIDSHSDHRIAMAFALAALRAEGAIQIADCANVGTSFPRFVETARQAGLAVEARD
ncbi:MAG: 3-phosphoshikimate 1-carboxyvinyltransferase [Gammaproteobacteria bacterium]|nr:3-phosphoshikimate 1-carboxyvinyltransferase [Gammaproteobacteria bacterium]MCP5424200.1 3-phosphoshikimate 1-carboxyvinyltransferase [Gammaproteobacteria bacterium]MCP5458923.1 3-phosphoshikimate 1-carboxyvinyltransferase [Gammaproteobacteria bacterium]